LFDAMNLCSGGRKHTHEEVCYEGNTCPCCAIISQKDEEIQQQAGEIRDLQERAEGAERELDQWRHDPLVPTLKQANGV
jgi:hypothetical protein